MPNNVQEVGHQEIQKRLEIRKKMSERQMGITPSKDTRIKIGIASKKNAKKRLNTMKKRNSFYRPFGNLNPMKNPITAKKVSDSLKGKTYEEIYGENIAKQRKTNMSKALKGKSYEKLFGAKKSKIIKQKHSESLSGEKSPSWLGGISKKIYHRDAPFLKQIRKRDNNECVLCGEHREKSKRSLDVHHINYIETEDTFDNCISLCHSCHQKANFNRRYWFEMFKNILRDKYGYEYTSNIKVVKYNNKEVKYGS
jgi:5-methylcytosine-specific restriction endonuclease McrA